MRIVYLNSDSPYIIGKQGETNAVTLRVDVTEWAADYPDGTGVILFTRPNKVVYPLETGTIVLDGKTYLQTIVTTKENKVPGWVILQAQWYNGDVLVKSMLFSGKVLVSGDGTAVDPTETVPSWVAEWMNILREAIDGAGLLIEAAETMDEDLAASSQAASTATSKAAAAAISASQAAASEAAAAISASEAMTDTPEGYANVVASISPTYNGTKTYAVGDYCINGGKLYRCTTAITEAEATFNSAHWAQVNVGSEVVDLKGAVANYVAAFPISAAGPADCIIIRDGAKGMPVKKLEVMLDPVQDLNGYSKPWVGGGGKNLLEVNSVSLTKPSSRVRTLTLTNTIPAGNYIFSGNVSGTASLVSLQFRNASETEIGDRTITFNPTTETEFSHALTISETCAAIYVYIATSQSDGVTADFSNLMLRPATISDASYEPYENICPITGHNNAALIRTGKNLLEVNIVSLIKPTSRVRTLTFTNTIPAGNYIFSGNVSGSSTLVSMQFRNASETDIGGGAITFNPTTETAFTKEITLSETCAAIYVYIATSQSDGVTADFSNLMLRPATISDASYEPYHSQIVSVDLFSATGGTVYGGTLTINDDKTGVITINRKQVILTGDQFTEKYNSDTNSFLVGAVVNDSGLSNNSADYYTDKFSANSIAYSDTAIGSYFFTGVLRVRVPANWGTTLAEVKSTLNNNGGITFNYPLANPVTYSITAEEMTTLYGINIIRTNAGNALVKYRADTNLHNNIISPKNYGAAGDGVADDTYAVQSAIDQAVSCGGTVLCDSSAEYLVKGLLIDGRMTFDGNGCMLKSNSTDPVISVNKTVNYPNGYIKNLNINMNYTASSGIEILSDCRTQYKNITLLNPAVNGYGIRIRNRASGCGFDTINGFSGNTAGTTFIYVGAPDANFNNIDWQNYVIGFDIATGCNTIIHNAHGYIARDVLFNDSIFLRTKGRMTIVNAYPDTQRKFFVIDTNSGVSIIGGTTWYNGNVVDLISKEQGYAFYSDNPSYFDAVSVIGFVFSQPEDSAKPYQISNDTKTPAMIGCFSSNNGSGSNS